MFLIKVCCYFCRDHKGDSFVKTSSVDYSENDEKQFLPTDQYDRMMMVMAAVDNGPHRELPEDIDNGPHRELPVDVPDTFIARNKTPPRYPPPKPKVVNIYVYFFKYICSNRFCRSLQLISINFDDLSKNDIASI